MLDFFHTEVKKNFWKKKICQVMLFLWSKIQRLPNSWQLESKFSRRRGGMPRTYRIWLQATFSRTFSLFHATLVSSSSYSSLAKPTSFPITVFIHTTCLIQYTLPYTLYILPQSFVNTVSKTVASSPCTRFMFPWLASPLHVIYTSQCPNARQKPHQTFHQQNFNMKYH